MAAIIDGHRRSLLGHDVVNGVLDCLLIPQVSGAAVPGPALTRGRLKTGIVQSSARVSFEGIEDPLRDLAGRQNYMDVPLAYVGGKELPLTHATDLGDGLKDVVAPRGVHAVARLIHEAGFNVAAMGAGGEKGRARHVVRPIHGALFVAVQAGAVATERDEIREGYGPFA
jgi:hypothetical protein